MRLSYALYGLGIAFFAAGYIAEVKELRERDQVWQKATASGINGSSSSQSSQPRQQSQQTTSE